MNLSLYLLFSPGRHDSLKPGGSPAVESHLKSGPVYGEFRIRSRSIKRPQASFVRPGITLDELKPGLGVRDIAGVMVNAVGFMVMAGSILLLLRIAETGLS